MNEKWNLNLGKAALKNMQKRASCRAFTDEEIPADLLREILETGIRAASGGNLQPYSIIVEKDRTKNEALARLCGGQSFMGKAPINLIFLLDFHKLSRISKLQDAPFTSHQSYMPYLIGVEDTICAAQVIETAAWQMGIGSVYIGTSNSAGRGIAKMYDLPEYTYPIVILTMGYAKTELPLRSRLPYELTVFEGEYPKLTDEEILNGYEAKYGTTRRPLPEKETVRKEWMERFRKALAVDFSPEKVEEIAKDVKEKGLKTFQYRFGLHYHAAEMLEHGREVMEMLKEQGIEPFAELIKGGNEDA